MPTSDPDLDRVEAMLVGFEHCPDALVVVTGPRLRVAAANVAAVRRLPEARHGVEIRDTLPALLVSSYDEMLRTEQVASEGSWSWTPWFAETGDLEGAIGRGRTASLDLVTALQDSLLPGELPLVPGVDVAARYLFAADADRAGGDWFDAVVCPRGCLMLVVGDVVGSGASAVVAMGQLRAVLHERLAAGVELHQALADLDAYACLRRESFAATVCVVELDPRTGAVAYCTAGHPPPLVVHTDGTARYLPLTGGSPLATGGGFPVVRTQLAPGELVLLFTDGSVERPGATPAQGRLDLAQLVAAAMNDDGITSGPLTRAPDRVCQLGAEVLTQLGHVDDVTLLAAQRVRTVEPLVLDLTTAPGTTAAARRALTVWLAELAPRELDDVAIQHAVGELVINAVEHAYGPTRLDAHGQPGAVRLSAHLESTGRLEVTVADRGRWRHDDTRPEGSRVAVADTVSLGARGRGIAMVRGFVDHLVVDTDEHGTRATLHHQLSRPVALLVPPVGAPLVPEAEPYAVVEDGARLWVSGSVDADVVDDLRLRLARASRGGLDRVRVDLAGVTFLGSAAVAALHEAKQGGHDLMIHAPPGSVAEQVLELVRLPYVG